MLAWLGRRGDRLATVKFVCRFFCLLFLAGFVAGAASGSDAESVPVNSAGLGVAFAIADFDGDLRPDVADVQIGRSDASSTDYWIQLQLSAAGRHRILVVAPSGGLQIAARDVNGDHALDLVVTAAGRSEPVAVFLNDGHGSFSRVDPADFPEAFREFEASWGSSSRYATDALGTPPQPRTGTCPAAARRSQAGSHEGVISPSQSGYLRGPLLDSHAGRAPPSKAYRL